MPAFHGPARKNRSGAHRLAATLSVAAVSVATALPMLARAARAQDVSPPSTRPPAWAVTAEVGAAHNRFAGDLADPRPGLTTRLGVARTLSPRWRVTTSVTRLSFPNGLRVARNTPGVVDDAYDRTALLVGAGLQAVLPVRAASLAFGLEGAYERTHVRYRAGTRPAFGLDGTSWGVVLLPSVAVDVPVGRRTGLMTRAFVPAQNNWGDPALTFGVRRSF